MHRLGQADRPGMRVSSLMRLISTAGIVVLIGIPISGAEAQSVPLLRQPSQGCPYVDREAAPQQIEELQARLAERRKAIERTKRMLPGLEAGSREAWARADRIMSDAPSDLITSFASDYAKTTSNIKARIRALQSSGTSKEKIELWLKTMNGLEDAGSFLKKAPASYEAGYQFGLDHQAEMANLQKEFVRTNDLFVKSGLAEELGGEFAGTIGGPLGKLAFSAGVMSVDLIVATEEAFVEAGAAQRVQSAIDAMEWAYSRDESELLRLDALLAENCNQPKEQMAESGSAAEPPPPAVAEEAPVSSVAGPDMGTAILLGGAAAAGAAALAVGLSGIGSTGADCGAAPSGFGSAWWSEYSAWCTCMGGTPVVSTTQCVQ